MLYSKKLKIKQDFSFAFRCDLKRRPFFIISVLVIFCIVFLGFSMRAFEVLIIFVNFFNIKFDRNYYFNLKKTLFDFSYVYNSFWIIIITMTTGTPLFTYLLENINLIVGFGEGFPSSHFGRCIGFFACIIGGVLLSLIVVTLVNYTEFTNSERKVEI